MLQPIKSGWKIIVFLSVSAYASADSRAQGLDRRAEAACRHKRKFDVNGFSFLYCFQSILLGIFVLFILFTLYSSLFFSNSFKSKNAFN
jgi:hypothetical protein